MVVSGLVKGLFWQELVVLLVDGLTLLATHFLLHIKPAQPCNLMSGVYLHFELHLFLPHHLPFCEHSR